MTLLPTYATNWNCLNRFGRGLPRDHSSEVKSKSNQQFQRWRCLSKKVDGRRMTDKGRSQNVSLKHNGIFVFQQLFVFKQLFECSCLWTIHTND